MTWLRLRGGLLATGAALVTALVGSEACGYPLFTYGSGGAPSSSSTGTGGSGLGPGGGDGTGATGGTVTTSLGGGGMSSSVSVSSSGGSGGGVLAQVDCAMGDLSCAPGEVCCHSEEDPSCDKCMDAPCEDSRSLCQQAPYDVYACDEDADCPNGYHCCAQIVAGNTVQQVLCFHHTCADDTQTRQMCQFDDDCPAQYPFCSDFGYPPFQVCEE